MKLNKKVEAVLNNQVNQEFWSAYMYLSMATRVFVDPTKATIA